MNEHTHWGFGADRLLPICLSLLLSACGVNNVTT